jgi:hypothetical protein
MPRPYVPRDYVAEHAQQAAMWAAFKAAKAAILSSASK